MALHPEERPTYNVTDVENLPCILGRQVRRDTRRKFHPVPSSPMGRGILGLWIFALVPAK